MIQSVAGDEWWEDMTVAMLEAGRKKLRDLVKLIEKGKSPFTDISQQGQEALFLPARVKEMVRVLEEIRERAVG